MKGSSIIIVSIGALALSGCASGTQSRPGTGMQGDPTGNEMAGMCPMAVEGTAIRAEDVEGGAAMVFTTTGDVAELRRRVAGLAEMHNRHAEAHGEAGAPAPAVGQSGGEPSPQGGTQSPTGMKRMQMVMPPSTARTEEIEGGARVTLTPRDPASLDDLRQLVRYHANQMESGQCPMMGPRRAPPTPPSS